MSNRSENIELNFATNAEQVKSQVESLLGSLDKNTDEYEKMTIAARGLAEAELELQRAKDALADSTNHTSGAVASMKSNLEKADTEYKKQISSIGDLTNKIQGGNDSTKSFTASVKSSTQSMLDNGGAVALIDSLTGGWASTLRDTAEASTLLTSGIGKTSTATAIWNAILALNPVVAIAAGVAILTTGLYFLTKAFLDEKGAVDMINNSLNLSKARQDSLTKSIDESRTSMTYSNNLEIARARALGKSSEEIDRLILKQKELVESTAFTNAKNARQAQIAAENVVRNARIVGDEEAIKKAQEFLKSQTALYTQYNKDFDAAIVDTSVFRFEVQQKAREKNDAAIVKSNENAIKAEDDYNKSILEKRKQYATDSNIGEGLTNTEVSIDDVINKIKTDGAAKLEADNEVMSAELAAKVAYGQNVVAENKIRIEEEIALEQILSDAKRTIQDGTINNITNGIGVLKSVFEKNKGLQKGLLIAESAAGIAKIIISTKAANAAAKLKYALIPGGVALAAAETTMNNIGAGIGIAANIAATAKGLSALGGGSAASGGGAGGNDSGGGVGNVGPLTQPSVSFVASSENQIANGINKYSKDQAPLKSYVVASDVSSQQALDRKLRDNTTL